MDVVASTVAVTQLLGQAITLIQEIQQARDTVSEYPKLIDGYSKQLEDLRRTLVQVQQKKELQTSGVAEQVARVQDLSQELEAFLTQMTGWKSKSTARQYAHAILLGKKDEKDLAGLLDRLDRARAELVSRVILAQAGLIGNLRDGFATAWPVVSRIDQNVQSILGLGSLVSTHVGDRQGTEKDGSTSSTGSDPAAIGIDGPPDRVRDERFYVRNITLNQARMIQGDIGAVTRNKVAKVVHEENEARDNSLMVAGGMDAQSFQALLNARK